MFNGKSTKDLLEQVDRQLKLEIATISIDPASFKNSGLVVDEEGKIVCRFGVDLTQNHEPAIIIGD